MSSEKIFFNIFMILFICYIFNRYLVTQKISLLVVMFGQFFSLILSITLLINNTEPNFLIQFVTSIFGIVIPGIIFFYNYFSKNGSFNAQEKFERFFELIKSVSSRREQDTLLLDDGSRDELGLAKEIRPLNIKDIESILRGYNKPADEVPKSVKTALNQTDKLLTSRAYRKTLEIYLSIEKQCGDNAVLQYNISSMYYYLKDFDNALERLNTALKINQAFEKTGRKFGDRSSHTTAARRIKNILKKVEDYEIAYNIAAAYVAKGKYDRAIEMFKKAGEFKGDNWVDIYKPMSIIYEKLGRKEEALEMYKNLSELHPEEFEYHKRTAELYGEMGNYTEAKYYYDKAVEVKPNYSDGYIRLGNLLLEKGQYEQAIETYNQAISIEPNISAVHYNLGIALYGCGEKVKALGEYKRAIELNENDFNSYYNLGVILDELDRKEDAVLSFEHCLDIKPDFYEASNNMAAILCSMGKYNEAIDAYMKALQFDPFNHELYFNLAITLECKGATAHAEELYRKIIKMKPDFADAYCNLAFILNSKDETENAEECFRKAVECDENCHRAYYQLARIYAARREYGRALDNLSKAIDISKEYIIKAESDSSFDEIRNLNGYLSIIDAQIS